MSIDYQLLKHLISGALGFAAMTYLTRIGLHSAPDRDGWHRIERSTMQCVAFLGSAAMALMVLYVRVFVGSARSDAESQMIVANWVIIVFSFGAALSFRQINLTRKSNVFWRQSTLCFTAANGGERLLPMTEIIGIRESCLGWIFLDFRDGSMLRLDRNAQGAAELCAQIVDVNCERNEG